MAPATARALLEWHLDMGVDEAIGEAPKNWFAPDTPPPVIQVVAVAAPEPVIEEAAPIPPQVAVTSQAMEEAKLAAAGATNLTELITAIKGFNGCPLKKTAKNTVVMDGNPEAKILLIGEAPGQQEDEQGIPFCGPSGKLLDKMLASIGWSRGNCLITNTIYWRPPNNRQPGPEEVMICRPFMEKFIALVDPELVIVVGGTAAKAVLGYETGITRLRGKMYEYKNPLNEKSYKAGVIFHPSYLLRQPSHKRLAWHDLLMLQNEHKG